MFKYFSCAYGCIPPCYSMILGLGINLCVLTEIYVEPMDNMEMRLQNSYELWDCFIIVCSLHTCSSLHLVFRLSSRSRSTCESTSGGSKLAARALARLMSSWIGSICSWKTCNNIHYQMCHCSMHLYLRSKHAFLRCCEGGCSSSILISSKGFCRFLTNCN